MKNFSNLRNPVLVPSDIDDPDYVQSFLLEETGSIQAFFDESDNFLSFLFFF